ncbi:MAG: nitrous oxide reductase family maturation protein NosD [Chitinophagaceae bacterium]|nr:nitrous oxide reductase family maturation protein NosD [Chitinophagaceae bacterium]
MKYPLFILFLLTLSTASGKKIQVFPGRLKQSVAAAGNGDTLLLQTGVYKEGTIVLSRPITLIGENNTILDGQFKNEILIISGYHINVWNLEFRNAGYSAMNDFAAIKIVDASSLLLDGNKIWDSYFAIHVSNSSFVTIRNNRITGNPKSEQLTGNGIHLWKCRDILVENNQVNGHRDGIYFEFVTSSIVRDNRSEKNIRYGLHFMFSNDDVYQHNIFSNNGAGVAVMYSKKVIMKQNQFEQNWGPSAYGLLLKDITDSDIRHNTFHRNTVGIHLEGSSRLHIEQNKFKGNGWAVKIQASCEDNYFTQNNFTGNSFDVGTNGTLVLNNFDNNYWDKYDGYDLNRDGTGDIPYHPVSLYSMIVEQQPHTLMLFRSFATQLLDKAEKAIPGLTPVNLADQKPVMKPFSL